VGVNLHIENLVLEGFRPADRHVIAEAIQLELARLAGTRGIPESFEINGPVSLQMTPRLAPAIIGARIAQSIYRGWSRNTAPRAAAVPGKAE
jgi:hypothetical protein